MTIAIAHVRQQEDGEWVVHKLLDHLEKVATKAAKFAESFGASEWAKLFGVWYLGE